MVGLCGDVVTRRGAGWVVTAMLMALVAALAVGCGGSTSHPPPTSPSAHGRAVQAVQVQQVPRDRWTYARARFREMCAGCHTLANARATGSRFNLDAVPALNAELIQFTILHGGPGMPPFASSISYREFEQIASYIMTVAGRHAEAEDRWRWQIELRREGEAHRPAGWPPRRYLTVPRYNP